MGTLLLLDIPKVPSDSTIQELLKSVFGMLGIKNLTRLDSDHMCVYSIVVETLIFARKTDTKVMCVCVGWCRMSPAPSIYS